MRALHLATCTLAPLIHLTDHNISPAVDKQLVLELEVREGLAKLVEGFPCSFIGRQSCPLDENMPIATTELGAQGVVWSLKDTTVAERWKRRRSRGRGAVEGLQDANVEHIVDARMLREL